MTFSLSEIKNEDLLEAVVELYPMGKHHAALGEITRRVHEFKGKITSAQLIKMWRGCLEPQLETLLAAWPTAQLFASSNYGWADFLLVTDEVYIADKKVAEMFVDYAALCGRETEPLVAHILAFIRVKVTPSLAFRRKWISPGGTLQNEHDFDEPTKRGYLHFREFFERECKHAGF